MKICVLSSCDSKGGAAKVAQRLIRGLRDRNHDVTYLVWEQHDDPAESTLIECEERNGIWHRLNKKMQHRQGLNAIGKVHTFPRRNNSVNFKDFDIVHLHDITRFNLADLEWLGIKAKLFWTIHSMAPFTGNCVFAFDCERWKTTCGQCPQFGKWPLKWLHKDASSNVLKIKSDIYRKSKLELIGVSNWLSNQLRESIMGHLPIQTIANALDVEQYFPIEKPVAKTQMGISPDEQTIAFSVSANSEDTRKGIDIILDAIPELKHNVTLMPMAIGANFDSLMERIGNRGNVRKPVHLASIAQLREYYSAADLVWHPSRADTSSLVSMEAMACGTPVVAAEVGGVPEVVGRDGDTTPPGGVLIPPNDPVALAQATDNLFDQPEIRNALAINARKRVEILFDINRFIDQHLELYTKSCKPVPETAKS